MEGRGRTILYAIAGLIALAIIFGIYSWWSGRRAEAARLALGKAIETADAPVVSGTPLPMQTGPTFPSERERAQKAVEEFEKVEKEHGGTYGELARYFKAVNLIDVDRGRGLSELENLSRSGSGDVAARARFALAQAREADGQYDAAAALYQELLKEKEPHVASDTLNLRLASTYEKQGKKDEAADLLFRVVEAARKAQGKDGKPQPETPSITAAADKLKTLNPERYAQLPPPPPKSGGGLTFGG